MNIKVNYTALKSGLIHYVNVSLLSYMKCNIILVRRLGNFKFLKFQRVTFKENYEGAKCIVAMIIKIMDVKANRKVLIVQRKRRGFHAILIRDIRLTLSL